jgi:DNA polymerase-1
MTATLVEPSKTALNYGRIRSIAELKALADRLLADGKTIGFDIETGYDGPDKPKGSLDMDWDAQFIVGFSITNSPKWARYVPVAHDFGENLPEAEAWEIIKPVLETLPVVAHHAKFEMRNLRLLAHKERGPRIDMNFFSDTMLETYCLGEFRLHGLKPLVLEVFGHQMADIKSLFPNITEKKASSLRFNILDFTESKVVDYACEDAAWCLALHERHYKRAMQQRPFMMELEKGIQQVLIEMEEPGCEVDWEQIKRHHAMSPMFVERMKTSARVGLEEQSGKDLKGLNIGSTQQLQDLLYRDLGLSTTRLTDKGKKKDVVMDDHRRMSTDDIALEGLAKQHPAIQKILEVRQVKNLADRHKKWVTEYATGHDGRVHASFAQTVVAAGRFSAKDPAIQQLPKKWSFVTELGVDIGDPNDDKPSPEWDRIVAEGTNGKEYWHGNFRDHLVAAPGWSLLGYDYSQVELRMLAGMSKEPSLLKAFADGVDIHITTAAAMLGKKVEEVTKADRAIGKTMNFALVYGMGAQSLSERLNITRERADELYAQYFSSFTLVTSWMEKMKLNGLRNGYVVTHFGRKVPIWEFQSEYSSVQNKGERLCVNAPVQGSAADYMKIAMLKARKALIAAGWWGTKVKLINNLHDALTFEFHNSLDPQEVRDVLKDAVVFPIKGFPPIRADWELGYRWGSCESWGTDQQAAIVDGVWQPVPEDGSAVEATTHAIVESVSEGDSDGIEGAEITVPSITTMPEPAPAVVEEPEQEASEVYRVTIERMPTPDQVKRFGQLLTEHAGNNGIILTTPEGDVAVKRRTSLGLADTARIQMVFGSAQVAHEQRETV